MSPLKTIFIYAGSGTRITFTQFQIIQMKNLLFLLLFLLSCFAMKAQIAQAAQTAQPYNITVTQKAGFAGTFVCKVMPVDGNGVSAPNSWTKSDLITWIFPDGQMMQREIAIDGSVVTNDTVEWSPFYTKNVKLNDIQAHVAKKGGTGNPSLVMLPAIPESSVTPTATAPRPIDFPTGGYWKASCTWAFSPGEDNYLVISYFGSSDCDSIGRFNIILPSGITMTDKMAFKTEDISTNANGNILIAVSAKSSNYRNVYLKLHAADTVTIGRHFELIISPLFCGTEKTNRLQYVAKGEPHDPNYKIVDIQQIPIGKADSTKLIYTIQFHNDGKGPVTKVTVIDTLPAELDPLTFKLLSTPQMNGLNFQGFIDSPPDSPIKEITFVSELGSTGLPGLNQPNQPTFDETIYRFSFEVMAKPNVQKVINNHAAVIFHLSDGTPLTAVITEVAQVKIIDPSAPSTEPTNFITCILWGLLAFFALIGFYLFWRHKTNKP